MTASPTIADTPIPATVAYTSVIIPTRDRSTLLARAIDSVLAQEDAAWELIVVDDGSQPAAAAMARDGLAGMPRTRFVGIARSVGAAAARNAGLERATGEYVAFLDDDDVWRPTFLARMTGALAAHPDADVAYCRRTIEAGARRYSPGLPDLGPHSNPLTILARGNFIDTSTAIVRRDRLRAVGGFDAALPRLQDWDLWLRLARGSRFTLVDEALVMSRMTEDGISASPARLEEACRLLAASRPEQLDLDRRARADFFYALATLLMVGDAPAAAGAYFRRSLRAGPFHPRRLAAATVAMAAPGLYAAVTRARRRALER